MWDAEPSEEICNNHWVPIRKRRARSNGLCDCSVECQKGYLGFSKIAGALIGSCHKQAVWIHLGAPC